MGRCFAPKLYGETGAADAAGPSSFPRAAEITWTARCRTFDVPARQTVTLTPYFDSNGLMSVGRSFSAIVV